MTCGSTVLFPSILYGIIKRLSDCFFFFCHHGISPAFINHVIYFFSSSSQEEAETVTLSASDVFSVSFALPVPSVFPFLSVRSAFFSSARFSCASLCAFFSLLPQLLFCPRYALSGMQEICPQPQK